MNETTHAAHDPRSLEFERGQRLMVLAPHPDDECLAAGGLLARAVAAGVQVRIVYVTAGDNAPWIQRVFERRWRIGPQDRARFGALRKEEARAAARELGVDAGELVFLDHPDQGINAELIAGDDTLLERLASELDRFRPQLLVVPSGADLHPDHSALAVLTRTALDRCSAFMADTRVFSYVVHSRDRARTSESSTSLWLDARERESKRNALLCYATQLSVHRRKFLDFARAEEVFAPADSRYGFEHHPLRRTSVRAGSLCLELAPHARPGAYGPLTLLLVLATEDGTLQTLSVRIKKRHGVHEVRFASQGGSVSKAFVAEHRDGLEVLLSLELFTHARRVFVKLERRFGFFDEAGWIEIAAPFAPPPSAPTPELAPRRRKSRAVCAVVPCYNIAALCGPVVRESLQFAEHVLAVDDGSTDGTGAVLRALAEEFPDRMRVLTFERNRGKGVALLEAFQHALSELPFDVLVTLDGDGQHRPSDIQRLATACRGGTEIVIGERMELEAMPLRSRLGYTLTSWLLGLVSSDAPTDTQSGMRAFDRSFVEEIARAIRGQRYETELRILMLALAQRRRITSVPIPSIYFNGNKSSHYRVLVDSARIYRALFCEGVPVLIAGHLRRRD